MNRVVVLFAATVMGLLASAPAEALNFKSYVSSVGTDANDCSTIALACQHFQRAHDQTVGNGHIACADSLDESLGVTVTTTITKSITIDCAGTSATSRGFIVNANGGFNVVVTIRNLRLTNDFIGIDFQDGAALFVVNCTITDMQVGAGPFIGIRFRPSAQGSRMVITDTLIKNNGFGFSGGGIVVQPQGSGSPRVTLDRVHVDNNTTGMFFNASSGQTIQAVIKNSTVSGNDFTGVYVLSGGGIIRTTIERSTIAHNGGTGVLSQGANAFVSVTGSIITGNNTGWTFAGGGSLITYLDNKVSLNLASDGAPSASLGPQ